MSVIERIRKLLGKKAKEPLTDYAIIHWNSAAEQNSQIRGNKYKEITIVENQQARVEAYSDEMIELLRRKKIPFYDITEGFDRPVKFISPKNLVAIDLSVHHLPLHGLRHKW